MASTMRRMGPRHVLAAQQSPAVVRLRRRQERFDERLFRITHRRWINPLIRAILGTGGGRPHPNLLKCRNL
jgi:hypothetical protein